MLIKLLSQKDRTALFKFAELLTVSDKPLLWNGRPMEEASALAYHDDVKFSIKRGDSEASLLDEWKETPIPEGERKLRKFITPTDLSGPYENGTTQTEKDLIDLLRAVPLKLDSLAAEIRAPALSKVIRKIHDENKITNKYAIRIALFELMLMAFSGGKINIIKYHILNELKHHYGVADEAFNEIFAQAEIASKVGQKTLALILE